MARTETDKCVACGRCVEVCPAGAVKLGQKLCAASTGKVPEYPKQELPDAVKWGPEKWSPDYRNKNRIETYDTGTSPCKTACPAHIAVQGYLKLAAQGRYRDALALIKRENPLPAICGRICNRRCEDACTRGRVDAAVAIDEVKKFIADQDLVAENRYVPEVVTPTRTGGFDDKIAVIGAGPAGLSCAFYLAEKGYKPVIFEKSARPGGMLTYGIPALQAREGVSSRLRSPSSRRWASRSATASEVGRDADARRAARSGLQGLLRGDRLPGRPSARHPGPGRRGRVRGRRLPAPRCRAAGERRRGGRACTAGPSWWAEATSPSTWPAPRRAWAAEHVEMFCLRAPRTCPRAPRRSRRPTRTACTSPAAGARSAVVADEEPAACARSSFKRCLRVFNDEGRFDPTYDEGETRTVAADRVVFSIGQAIRVGQPAGRRRP
ncbi:MAG: FAD-dependent oxidoreductase [Collinsella sp.]